MQTFPSFPPEFLWGAATASYQIEGSPSADGKGTSIWDDFVRRRGAIHGGQTGDTACDHYRRWKEDVRLMGQLGLTAYRFSIAWTRLLPDGTGSLNRRGVDFYRALVEALLEEGIRPWVTLYHWDLPAALQRRGGWAHRDSVHWFGEYVGHVEDALGDVVGDWITLNEPWVHAALGHFMGSQAPGIKSPWRHYAVLHNLLRAHGTAVRLLKERNAAHQVGITLNLRPLYPQTDHPKDHQAVHYADLATRRVLLDPLFRGAYPDELLRRARLFMPKITAEDLDLIATPCDFLGINNYTRERVRHAWWFLGHNFWSELADAEQRERLHDGVQYTAMGWEVYADSLYEILMWIHDEYGNPPVYITENGAAFNDSVVDGAVHDDKRVDFYKLYIDSMGRAMAAGSDCRGYFAWTLMDNFEWAEGFEKRFGLIHVDFATQQRIIKDSGLWYRDLIAAQKR